MMLRVYSSLKGCVQRFWVCAKGVRNAEQGISLIQLAEGSLNEVGNILRRMRELSVQSANSTMNDANRGEMAAEFNQLSAEIDRIAVSTTYNDQILLTGFGNAVSQNSDVSTALDGFSGVREIAISGPPVPISSRMKIRTTIRLR